MKSLEVAILIPETAAEEEELSKLISRCLVHDIAFEGVVHRSRGRFATIGDPSPRFFHVLVDARGRRTVVEDYRG